MAKPPREIVIRIAVPDGCSVRVVHEGAGVTPPPAPRHSGNGAAEAMAALDRHGVRAAGELISAYSADRIMEVVRYVDGRGPDVKSPAALILSCLKRGYTVRKTYLGPAGEGG